MNVDMVLKFIQARHDIYLRRKLGQVPPWTEDPILSEYRFCNVYRELDKVTIWIHQNWLKPNLRNPDVWFAMVVARFLNHPDTLQDIGFPVPFKPFSLMSACAERKGLGKQVFTGAYIIHADIKSVGVPKPEYLTDKVFMPLWNARKKLRPKSGEPLEAFFGRLRQFHDMGSFMSAQVVADVKWSLPPFTPDWWTFAASGPGSKRGLNRVLGRDVKAPWAEEDWKTNILLLRDQVNSEITKWDYAVLCAQNLQNVLCEVDKYERVRLGQGRPRSKYRYPVSPAPELFA